MKKNATKKPKGNSKTGGVQVAIIMGSQSDSGIMKGAAQILKNFNVKVEMKVVSAHRTPEYMQEYALKVRERGIQVIIAGAGGAAHLPGMVASLTTIPVIGVPVAVNKLSGLDSLLSIAQMPRGIPVATVAIDNSENAGLLALRILSLKDPKIAQALDKFRTATRKQVLKSQKTVNRVLGELP